MKILMLFLCCISSCIAEDNDVVGTAIEKTLRIREQETCIQNALKAGSSNFSYIEPAFNVVMQQKALNEITDEHAATYLKQFIQTAELHRGRNVLAVLSFPLLFGSVVLADFFIAPFDILIVTMGCGHSLYRFIDSLGTPFKSTREFLIDEMKAHQGALEAIIEDEKLNVVPLHSSYKMYYDFEKEILIHKENADMLFKIARSLNTTNIKSALGDKKKYYFNKIEKEIDLHKKDREYVAMGWGASGISFSTLGLMNVQGITKIRKTQHVCPYILPLSMTFLGLGMMYTGYEALPQYKLIEQIKYYMNNNLDK